MEIPLLYLQAGKRATIKKLDGGIGCHKKLASLNLRIGKTIKKITVLPFNGPVVVKIDNTSVSMGRGLAECIFVQEEL